MDDIIWVTYNGRHIPIKPGMRGKFNKKKLNLLKEKRKGNKSGEDKKGSNIKRNKEEDSKNKEVKINYHDETPKYAEVIGEKFGERYEIGNEETFRKWTEEQNIKTEKPKVNYNTVSDYEQYFIGLGYSKATALKRAKEIIAERKRKK